MTKKPIAKVKAEGHAKMTDRPPYAPEQLVEQLERIADVLEKLSNTLQTIDQERYILRVSERPK